MRLIATIVLFCVAIAAQAQVNNVYGTIGTSYTVGPPTFRPGSRGAMVAIDTITFDFWVSTDRNGATWVKMGDRIQKRTGCIAPIGAPAKYESSIVLNSCATPELYEWNGSDWVCITCGSGGGVVYTAGTGIAISGTNEISNTGDLSTTNELQNLSLAGQALGISSGTGVTLPVVGATASDFDLASGVLSLDYTNAQKATSLIPGFLSAADWSTFNGKQAAGNYITGLTGDVTASGPGSVSATVTRINGTSLAGLATGILKNTTTTGVPSIAIAADFPTLNQNTTGNAATVTTNASLSGPVTSVGNVTSIANGAISNAMLANSSVANLSGTNTGDNAVNSLYSGLVSNATHTGDASGATALVVTGINNTNLAGLATGILKNTTTTGVPSIAVAADFPTLNQNTTGSAATLTTSRTIYGNAFNGSANVTGIIGSAFGGTGNGFTLFSGPTTAEKTFTLPNASATILTSEAAVTAPQGGTGQTVYVVGDLLHANTTTTLARLPAVATGNALISGGIGVVSTWGKIGLTTHISGILAGANGGTANGFMAFTGPATALKTFTLPNASATILTTNAAVTATQGGTGATTLTGVLFGNGTSAFTGTALGGDVTLFGSNGTAPLFYTLGFTNISAAVGASRSGSTLNLNIPDADASFRGLIVPGAQTFGTGAKTFGGAVNASGLITGNAGLLGVATSTAAAVTASGVFDASYVTITAGTTLTEANNMVEIGTLTANITIALPACNSTRDGWAYEFQKTGTDAFAAIIDPNGTETFYDAATTKSIYSQGSFASCKCKGSINQWLWKAGQ